MEYLVRHVPRGGVGVVEELVDAASEAEVRAAMHAAHSVVLAVRMRPSARILWAGAPRFEVALWCHEMESLLRAGMTAVEAIETLATSAKRSADRWVHVRVLEALHQGAALSRAMRASGAFPEVLLAGVTASERTSTLAQALRDYLRFDELLQRLRRQAVSAALYPALVISLGLVIALFLLLYVIPRFTTMYGSFHGELSAPTAFVLGLSRLMRDHGWLVLAALLACAVGLGWVWRTGRLSRAAERVLDAVPSLREPWDHFRLAKLYQSLTLLFKGGYSLDESLAVCVGLTLGQRMVVGVRRARDAIAQGKSASVAMTSGGLADPTASRLLAVGERTGDFAGVLQAIADRHSEAFVVFVERATRLVEPLLLLGVALVVGGLVVMMYLPIFDVAGGLGVAR
jgi:general secretion pathway protein F